MTTPERTAGRRWLNMACRTLFGERFEALRTKSARRRLSVAYVAVAVAFPLAGHLMREMWAVLAVLLAFGAVTVLLGIATRGIFDKPLRYLDERQRHMRLTVIGNPYFVGVAMGLAGGLVVAASFEQPDPVMAGWVLAVNAALFGLPAVIGAWTFPGEVDDDG